MHHSLLADSKLQESSVVNLPKPEPLFVLEDDPLAGEHAAVRNWVEDAFEHLGENNAWQNLDLKALSSGRALLNGTPAQLRRFTLAAVAQVQHWDSLISQMRGTGSPETERWNAHLLPGWNRIWGRRRQAEGVVNVLMRRNLPFDESDLLLILNWCCGPDSFSHSPVGSIVRALHRYSERNAVEDDLLKAMRRLVDMARSSYDKSILRLGTEVAQLCAEHEPATATVPVGKIQPPARPAPAGSENVLDALKRELGMLPSEPLPATTLIDPDQFPLRDDSRLRIEHGLLNSLFEELVGTPGSHNPYLNNYEAGKKLISLSPGAMGRVLLAAAERHVNSLISRIDDHELLQAHYAAAGIASSLLQRTFEVDRDGKFDLLLYLAACSSYTRMVIMNAAATLNPVWRQEASRSSLSEGERYVLTLYRASRINGPALGSASDEVNDLTAIIQDGASFFLVPGEAWTDALNTELSQLNAKARAPWVALLRHALTATGSRPSAKWLKTAGQFVEATGHGSVRDSLLRWFPLVSHGRTVTKLGRYSGDARGSSDTMHDENANCLRGLLWSVPLLPPDDELGRAVTSVAIGSYKKVPGIGPRAVKVGNAAVYALSQLASKEAVGQLAMLKVRVRFGTAQKEIEKAFDAAAAALDLPRDQIEELGIPSYGLEEVGRLREELGSHRAELVVTGSDVALKWFDDRNKPLKSVPSKVKTNHKEELKELQQSLKDIQAMLPAQRDRIDGLFLMQKSWPISEWRERYLDHPLVGTIARRLIWCVDGIPAIFPDGMANGVDGEPVEHGQTAEITLWHPVGRTIDEVTAWRRRLEEVSITQPFKQAHREVYLLTDAERRTRTYSNRFAAHVIRQHQFNALCAARGWKNKLRLMVDDSYPPATKELPQWGLRAEFWIEGIGQDYGVDTNDTGTFLRLSTDQVRFYRTGAATNYAHAGGGGYGSSAVDPGEADINAALPLEDVPPLVLSEVLRDVDLFVGVASVGNDPTWQDGGPEGRYRDYWHSYSFGELSGSAATRKETLERLIPRLKIANRCSFSDRFLVVRGDKRTYKIHLGSGNILMEPNDQYLCIVPDARARASRDDLYLPFEGDATLSIILSKAFLLADDVKIKDPTITRQINGQ